MQVNDAPVVRFTNVEELFDDINATDQDLLIVINISLKDFTKIQREREKRRRKFRVRRYNVDAQVLFITVTTGLHETLHAELYQLFRKPIVLNDWCKSWVSLGATTFHYQGSPRAPIGEGDSTGGPSPERRGRGEWPNCCALIERWEEQIPHLQGPITRRRHAAILQQNDVLEPVKRQTITITRDETTDPVSYDVAGGPLVLEFRLLFLRDPSLEDRDVVINIEDLQDFGMWAWEMAS
ncbi:uncharacterized protein C8A04DRAFT_37519 [Dichotomopilus funicola]|uniref:Uncharacterized protein n=1 Tax=Dichotomopilus funicola TaxID=1934379 RepID=A0AAN6V235_9PEZI|nr:hypothetical protein C8A04DRAFT_37519 [Dichotomopilus funicola]